MTPLRTAGRDRAASGQDAGVAVASLPETLPSRLGFSFLLVFLAIAPWYFSYFWLGLNNFIPQAMFLLGTAVTGLLLATSSIQRSKFELLDWLMVAFLAYCSLSYFTTVYRHDSLLEIVRVAGIVVWFFIARAYLRSSYGVDRLSAVTLVAVLGVVVVAAQAAANYFSTRDPRQFGTFVSPNLLANAVAMALPYALVSPIILRRKFGGSAALGGVVALIILAAGLVVTSSKGGFASALVAMCVTALMAVRARPDAVKSAAGKYWWLLAMGGVLFAALAMKTVIPRLRGSFGATDHSTMFRLYTWDSTWDMALARPILGHGAGTFPFVFPQFAVAGYTRHAHQQWLQIAAEYGIPAMLLLAATCVVALGMGWKQLKTTNWPFAAGAIGALVAFILHGCTDSGWNVTSVALLFVVTLAMLGGAEREVRSETPHSRLSYSWLFLTLVAMGGASQSLRAYYGELGISESERLLRSGAPSEALRLANNAFQDDPGSSRAINQLAQATAATGNLPEALKLYERAAEILPLRAANWFNVAGARADMGDFPGAEAAFDQSLKLDAHNTGLLLARARFRLNSKDSAGIQDLERIVALWDEPYGKYQAIPEIVNLDFVRATDELMPYLLQNKKFAQAEKLLEHAFRDIATARFNDERNRKIGVAVGDLSALPRPGELDTLEANLNSWQEQLRSAKAKP